MQIRFTADELSAVDRQLTDQDDQMRRKEPCSSLCQWAILTVQAE